MSHLKPLDLTAGFLHKSQTGTPWEKGGFVFVFKKSSLALNPNDLLIHFFSTRCGLKWCCLLVEVSFCMYTYIYICMCVHVHPLIVSSHNKWPTICRLGWKYVWLLTECFKWVKLENYPFSCDFKIETCHQTYWQQFYSSEDFIQINPGFGCSLVFL